MSRIELSLNLHITAKSESNKLITNIFQNKSQAITFFFTNSKLARSVRISKEAPIYTHVLRLY